VILLWVLDAFIWLAAIAASTRTVRYALKMWRPRPKMPPSPARRLTAKAEGLPGLTLNPNGAQSPTPFGILDGKAPFTRMIAAYAPYKVSPYDYWRQQWMETGDPEALHQMTRFVEETDDGR
jgi:hypothetical protein